jgi:hypothetical protein
VKLPMKAERRRAFLRVLEAKHGLREVLGLA